MISENTKKIEQTIIENQPYKKERQRDKGNVVESINHHQNACLDLHEEEL